MSITITVPNDDHVALRAMAKALEEIAVARGAAAHSLQVTMGPICTVPMSPEQEDVLRERLKRIKDSETRAKADGADPISQEVRAAQVDTTSQQVESLSSVVNREVHFDNPSPQVSDNTTDSTGTPWDERIHSASKALNADGSWRVRRKPADKTQEEWSDYIKWVEEDIHLVLSLQGSEEEQTDEYSADVGQVVEQSINAAHQAIAEQYGQGLANVAFTGDRNNSPEPSVTPEGDDFHVDAGAVTEQEVAAPPLPVPPMPPVLAALEKGMERYGDAMSKLAEDDGKPALTFPQVMQFLTERHGRITSPEVDQIIADMGLSSIMDLNTQPEHTGPFIARVKAHLGE